MHLQAFHDFFSSQPDPKRLFGYSKYGETYYAAPGQCASFSNLNPANITPVPTSHLYGTITHPQL